MKRTITLILTAVLASNVAANGAAPATGPAIVPAVQTPAVLSKRDVVLNGKEWKSAEMASQWIYNREDVPVMSDNGKLVFLFGRSMPTIICAPLHPCDLELQPGEKVYDVHVGDTVRWKVSPAQSGPADYPTMHAIIKPTNNNLMTTLTITTDRRAYHMRLKARKKNFMPYVGFEYPEDIKAQWAEALAKQQHQEQRQTIPETSEKLADLDFEYTIKGDARWKPVRVYNDGVKTIIQMPKEMSQTEAPALLVLGREGDEQLVNYRLKGDRYIVDYIFDSAELIAGVGSNQDKVVIARAK